MKFNLLIEFMLTLSATLPDMNFRGTNTVLESHTTISKGVSYNQYQNYLGNIMALLNSEYSVRDWMSLFKALVYFLAPACVLKTKDWLTQSQ